MLQPARADAVRALLVFLDLLKRQAKCAAESRLAHCQHHPAHAHPAADVLLDGIWGLLADGIHHRFRIEKSDHDSYRDKRPAQQNSPSLPKPGASLYVGGLDVKCNSHNLPGGCASTHGAL